MPGGGATTLLEADGRPLPRMLAAAWHVTPEAFARHGGQWLNRCNAGRATSSARWSRWRGVDAWQQGDLVEFRRLVTESASFGQMV